MIGLFGGSFDPVHEGHIFAATWLLDNIPLQKILLIPASKNPHKVKGPEASAIHRVEMLKKALRETKDRRLEIFDGEIKRDTTSFTAVTLEELKTIYPTEKFALILGNEVFQQFHNWFKPRTILSLSNLIVIQRDESESTDVEAVLTRCTGEKALKESPHRWELSNGNWVRLEIPPVLPFSSTQIRKELAIQAKRGESTSPPRGIQRSVWLYIKENSLYSVI